MAKPRARAVTRARQVPCPETWRESAARIAEEILSCCDPAQCDQLLDLRSGLLRGEDWNATLDLFLTCREKLEASHYLPFYRLRQLLTSSLELEVSHGADSFCERSLEPFLRSRHRSMAHLARTFEREHFEHQTGPLSGGSAITLRVRERPAFRSASRSVATAPKASG